MDDLFTSRRQIEIVMVIVSEWIEQNPESDKREAAVQFLQKLDYLHMCW